MRPFRVYFGQTRDPALIKRLRVRRTARQQLRQSINP